MENPDDQFSLKWNNFQSNLATGFHDLLQDEDMVDVTLAAEGKILYAHKIILSVCSPYFKDLFKVNPCKHPIVILKDVGHQELADMLDFMYRGEASVRQEDLAAFLKLAETLKVKGLAGDKEESSSVPPPQSQRKQSSLVPRKKKLVETPAAYEPEEDPGDPDFNPGVEQKKRKKRITSPQPKTDNTSTSATNNSFVPLANPKQEVQEQDDVEFLDDTTNDPLVHFITGKQAKQEEEGNEFDDPNQEMAGDETHDGEMDMTAGPSNPEEMTEQVPQGNKWQDYKYIQSKNGKYLLIYEGFSYRKYMTSKSRQSYWTCTLRGCKAKATMKPDGWFSLTKYTHNHEPNYEEMQRKAIISELRKLTLETELSPAELLRQVGIVDDPDKKFRDTINFWRWRAKRKTEAESAGFYEDSKKLQFDDDYKFVKTHHSHFLQYKNYLYRKYMSSKVDSGSYWRCRRDDCPARAKLDSSGLLTCTNFNHNHPEEEFEGEDMEQDIKQVVREMALNTDVPIGEILKMYHLEEDIELKKYIKNIRCRKQRNLREKKRKVEETVINQIEMLENVPPGVFVKIPKDLLCEISELPVNQEGEIEYPEGTILKVDDRALVQVVNFDPECDSFDGELFFKNETEDEAEQRDADQEVQYETVNMSDYTTYVITSDKEIGEEEMEMEELEKGEEDMSDDKYTSEIPNETLSDK